MTFAGKTVLVTGASRGIGRALVDEALARGAAQVYAGVRQPLKHPDGRVTPLTLDITSREQIQQAAAHVGSLDILVNNAGVFLYDDLSLRPPRNRSPGPSSTGSRAARRTSSPTPSPRLWPKAGARASPRHLSARTRRCWTRDPSPGKRPGADGECQAAATVCPGRSHGQHGLHSPGESAKHGVGTLRMRVIAIGGIGR